MADGRGFDPALLAGDVTPAYSHHQVFGFRVQGGLRSLLALTLRHHGFEQPKNEQTNRPELASDVDGPGSDPGQSTTGFRDQGSW